MKDGKAIDITVVDQMRWPAIPTEWLEFGRLSVSDTCYEVSACSLFEGPRIGAAMHMSTGGMALATPAGWAYEASLNASHKFVGNEKIDSKPEFLRDESGVDVYPDRSIRRNVYAALPKKGDGETRCKLG